MVPMQMPPYNVWTLSLCLANGGCITSSDSSVIIAFPCPGFSIGGMHPSTANLETSDASSRLGRSHLPMAALLGLFTAFYWALVN